MKKKNLWFSNYFTCIYLLMFDFILVYAIKLLPLYYLPQSLLLELLWSWERPILGRNMSLFETHKLCCLNIVVFCILYYIIITQRSVTYKERLFPLTFYSLAVTTFTSRFIRKKVSFCPHITLCVVFHSYVAFLYSIDRFSFVTFTVFSAS